MRSRKQEKQPCWLARLYRAIKRKHWNNDEEALQDAQVFTQVAITLTVINVVAATIQVVKVVLMR